MARIYAAYDKGVTLISTAKLITEREVLVKIPEGVKALPHPMTGELMVVEPGSGLESPLILISTTEALRKGLLELV